VSLEGRREEVRMHEGREMEDRHIGEVKTH
jgi:hypothetical protein